jgi:hypothetical protein
MAPQHIIVEVPLTVVVLVAEQAAEKVEVDLGDSLLTEKFGEKYN